MSEEELLFSVLTLSEAMHCFGQHKQRMMMDVYRGRLVARKSKGTWVVTFASCLKTYGTPKYPVIDWENE